MVTRRFGEMNDQQDEYVAQKESLVERIDRSCNK